MIKKILLYILVFVASLFIGMFTYERPNSEGSYEEYIYKNPYINIKSYPHIEGTT